MFMLSNQTSHCFLKCIRIKLIFLKNICSSFKTNLTLLSQLFLTFDKTVLRPVSIHDDTCISCTGIMYSFNTTFRPLYRHVVCNGPVFCKAKVVGNKSGTWRYSDLTSTVSTFAMNTTIQCQRNVWFTFSSYEKWFKTYKNALKQIRLN